MIGIIVLQKKNNWCVLWCRVVSVEWCGGPCLFEWWCFPAPSVLGAGLPSPLGWCCSFPHPSGWRCLLPSTVRVVVLPLLWEWWCLPFFGGGGPLSPFEWWVVVLSSFYPFGVVVRCSSSCLCSSNFSFFSCVQIFFLGDLSFFFQFSLLCTYISFSAVVVFFSFPCILL